MRAALQATYYDSSSKAFADQLGVCLSSLSPHMGLTKFAKPLPFSTATGVRLAPAKVMHANEFVGPAIA